MPESSTSATDPIAVLSGFPSSDPRVPEPLKRLLTDADGCLSHGYLVGATLCVHQSLEELLKQSDVPGTNRQTRLVALSRKHPAVPQLFVTVLSRLEEKPAESKSAPDESTLQLFLTTLKAILYEIYVLGTEREKRIAHVQRLLDKRGGASESQTARSESLRGTSAPELERQGSTAVSASVAQPVG